jgi:hypothetical protein
LRDKRYAPRSERQIFSEEKRLGKAIGTMWNHWRIPSTKKELAMLKGLDIAGLFLAALMTLGPLWSATGVAH